MTMTEHGVEPKSAATSSAHEADHVAAADKTIATILGEIVWLMSWSETHKQVAIGELEQLVMAPILLRQMRVFYDGDQPAAAVLYARLSAELALQLDAGSTPTEMSLDDWRSGETLRIMRVIAPYGGGELYAQETLAVLQGSPAASKPQ